MALKMRGTGVLVAGLLTAGLAQAAPPTTKVRSLGTAKAPVVRTVAPIDHKEQGFSRLRAGDRDGALQSFLAATQVAPTDPLVWQLAGDLQFDRDERAAALVTWSAGIERAGTNPVLLERVLRGAIELGEFDRAADAAGALYELVTSDDHRLELGGVRSELATLAGDYTLAEEVARELIKRYPHRTEGRVALAYMHLQAGELTEAEDLYREVLAAEPTHTTALNNLGNIHYLERDLDSASDFFEAILAVPELSPHAESLALSNLAELFQLQGGFKYAEALYREAIQVRPQAAFGYMGLAALLDMTGRHDEAVDAMIDGWERDENRLTRLNMHFFQPEWQWQRDALIAEIEGEPEVASKLWSRVQSGDVKALHRAAVWHLDALDSF